MAGILQTRTTWDCTSSTAVTPYDFQGFGLETTFYIQAGAGATTGTITIQSARTAAGPWATIASTAVSNASTLVIQEVTGPLLFVRPVVQSTGYIVEAVSFG